MEYNWTDHWEWNGQDRDLGRNGDQGRQEKPKEWVNKEVCPGLCRAFMKVEHGVEGSTGRGKQIVWNDVDDMCEWCRNE